MPRTRRPKGQTVANQRPRASSPTHVVRDDASRGYGFFTFKFRNETCKERFRRLVSGNTGSIAVSPKVVRKAQSALVATPEDLTAGVAALQDESGQLSTPTTLSTLPEQLKLLEAVIDESERLSTQADEVTKIHAKRADEKADIDIQPRSTQREAEPHITTTKQSEAPAVPKLRLNTTFHAPLSRGRSGFGTQSEESSTTEPENRARGFKRSRTPEPPSLTSGAPSALSTPLSSSSAPDSQQLPPAQRPGTSRRRATARGRKASAGPSPAITSVAARKQKIVTFRTSKLPNGIILDPVTMAPVRDPTDVSNKIKDVIQNLFDVQSQTHGFVPETQDLLIGKMEDLTQSLADLQRLTDKNLSPNNPVHNIDLAPEIVDYVDDGRNPDIFTRDFVELVQRGNAVVNGKKQAFRDFSQVYAKALKEGIGGVDRHVDMIMDNAGIEQVENEGAGKREGTDSGQKPG